MPSHVDSVAPSEGADQVDVARMPSIPERSMTDRPPLPLDQRPQAPLPDAYADFDESVGRSFHVRQPFSDLSVRPFVVLVPLALAGVAAMLGREFQKQAQSFAANGAVLDLDGHHFRVDQTVRYMGVIGFVGVAVLALWSWLTVTNTNRVGHTLRSPAFAAAGWVLAPGLGYAAHLTLDHALKSGYLAAFAVALTALYVPFGTIGGAASDLGGSPHLARTWYLASVVGTFLFLISVSGATDALPDLNPQHTFTVRSASSYLSALMMVLSAALAYGTARNIRALTHHRWIRDLDPDGARNDIHSVKVIRRGEASRRRMIPTVFLRAIVAGGMFVVGGAAVIASYYLRGRALKLDPDLDIVQRDHLLDDYRHVYIELTVVQAGLYATYVLWAIVAAINARRRSLLVPRAWSVIGCFLLGPAVLVAGAGLRHTYGAAVILVGLGITGLGFIIGQTVLGRTVSALGGRGGVFLSWLLVGVAMNLFLGFVSLHTNTQIQVVAAGVIQTCFAIANGALAWTAMSRLDHAARAIDPMPDTIRRGVVGAAHSPAALTSSHS